MERNEELEIMEALSNIDSRFDRIDENRKEDRKVFLEAIAALRVQVEEAMKQRI